MTPIVQYEVAPQATRVQQAVDVRMDVRLVVHCLVPVVSVAGVREHPQQHVCREIVD